MRCAPNALPVSLANVYNCDSILFHVNNRKLQPKKFLNSKLAKHQAHYFNYKYSRQFREKPLDLKEIEPGLTYVIALRQQTARLMLRWQCLLYAVPCSQSLSYYVATVTPVSIKETAPKTLVNPGPSKSVDITLMYYVLVRCGLYLKELRHGETV